MHDVEIRDARLDHDNVRALLNIQRHLAQRLVRIRRVHLVTPAIAELGRGFRRLAERAVKRGGKLRRVTHDRRVGETFRVKFRADGANAAIHHVARGDDVRAGLGVACGGAGEQLERRVVQNFGERARLGCGRTRPAFDIFGSSGSRGANRCSRGGCAPQNAAMPVRHVFAEADIRDDEQRGQFLFQQPHGLLHDAVLRVSAGSLVILFVGNAEEQNGWHAERVGGGGFAQQFIRRKLEHAGHGGDGLADFFAAADKERQDELLHAQAGLADEAAEGGILAETARAADRELAERLKVHGLILVSKREVQSGKLGPGCSCDFIADQTGVVGHFEVWSSAFRRFPRRVNAELRANRPTSQTGLCFAAGSITFLP